jgi:hypothetical protein
MDTRKDFIKNKKSGYPKGFQEKGEPNNGNGI